MQSRFGLSGVGPAAADMALQACVEVAKALGWQPKEDSSEAELHRFQLKVEERAAELSLRISDAARRPSRAAVRQAIRECLFFEEEYQASVKDRAWFSRNRDRNFRARKPFIHETQRLSASYRQKAIVLRDHYEDCPVLLLITNVHYPVDWRSDIEIMQFVDCSHREFASVH
jgi:hypothetical protein